MRKDKKAEYAKCKVCGNTISLALSPLQSFKKQQKAIFSGYCSIRCSEMHKGGK